MMIIEPPQPLQWRGYRHRSHNSTVHDKNLDSSLMPPLGGGGGAKKNPEPEFRIFPTYYSYLNFNLEAV